MVDLNTTRADGDSGYAHVVEVEKLTLQNHAQQNVDLRMVFTEFQVTTSIFSPAITGSVLLYDTHALINRFPIVGEEALHVEYKTPGNLSKKNVFRVYKVSGEQPDPKGAASSYRLHFCSPELLTDAVVRVQKSFRGTDDSSAIVGEILRDELKSGKNYNGTPMQDPAKVLVIPNYNPFEAIDMLIRRGYTSASSSNYYFFFERMDGYWLRTIDELAGSHINRRQREAGVTDPSTSPDPAIQALETWYVYASDKYQMDSTRGKDIRRINAVDLRQRFDSLQKIREGLYESEVVQISLVEKTLTPHVYQFNADGKQFLGGTPDPAQFSDRKGGSGIAPLNTASFITEYSTGQSGFAGAQASKVFYRLKDPEEKDGVIKKSHGLYNGARVGLNQIQISITVPGDTMVDAGDVVHLVVPQFESVTGKAVEDKFLYGAFVIGTLRDSILTPDKHVMVLDLFRDGYWKPISVSEMEETRETES